MTVFSKEVHEIAKECAEEYLNDIQLATEEACRGIKELDNYEEIIEGLLLMAVKELIYRERQTILRTIKKSVGKYDSVPKISIGKSGAVRKIYQSIYNMTIGGKTLGVMTGDEVLATALQERNQGNGKLVNATFLEKLGRIVPSNRTVKQSVPESKVRELFREARVEIYGTEDLVDSKQ